MSDNTETSLINTPMTCRKRSAFIEGCIDASPVSLTFVFLFFSIGAASSEAGFTALQAMVMTLTVHAAPLQVFLTQHGVSLTVMSILLTTLVVNFRFVIMSSVLAEHFKGVPLWKSLLCAQLLSISTFTLSTGKKDKIDNLHGYYLGCGVSTLSVAVIATVAGFWISTEQGPYLKAVIGIILPVHFTALAALSWPKLKPLLVTMAGFALTPVAGRFLQEYQIFVVPFVLAGLMLAFDALKARHAP